MSMFDTNQARSGTPGGNCLLDTPDMRVRPAAAATMASTLANEISQPLTSATNYIHTCATLLRRKGGGYEDVLAMMEHASQELLKAGEVIRQVRSFIVSGRIAARRENLRTMVDKAASAIIRSGGADVAIMTTIPMSVFVAVDRIRIEQVFASILLHACEALDGYGQRRITISSAHLDDKVVVRFEERGPRLPQGVRTRVFAPSFPAKAHGNGLGMPICKAIVEGHGGRLWAGDAAGGGAAWNLSLPAADQPGEQSG